MIMDSDYMNDEESCDEEVGGNENDQARGPIYPVTTIFRLYS